VRRIDISLYIYLKKIINRKNHWRELILCYHLSNDGFAYIYVTGMVVPMLPMYEYNVHSEV